MDNNHSGQPLQAGSSEKLLPSAPASTSPFPPDVKATTGLTEVQVNTSTRTFIWDLDKRNLIERFDFRLERIFANTLAVPKKYYLL